MPLGFGNAIVLQTMFSQFYIIIVTLLDGRVMIADFFFFKKISRPSFSFTGVADGCWNGFCSIAKRFRFVELNKSKDVVKFTDDVFFPF